MDVHLLVLYEELLVENIRFKNGECYIGNCSMEILQKAIFSVGCFYNSSSNLRVLGALARLVLNHSLPRPQRFSAYQMFWNVLGQFERIPVSLENFEPDTDIDLPTVQSFSNTKWTVPSFREEIKKNK